MWEETGQLTNGQNVKALHQKHTALAKVAAERGDRVLSESHYQRAEYYFHTMKEQGNSAVTANAIATARASARASHSTKKVIKDFDLRRTSRKEPSDTRKKPEQEGNVTFRGSFLRRNRRGIQDKETPE